MTLDGPGDNRSSDIRTLIVGVGSMFGDDQAGWMAAQQLCASLAAMHASGEPSGDIARTHAFGSDHGETIHPAEFRGTWGVCEVRLATIPLDVIDWLENIDTLIVIDACQSESAPGTIRRLQLTELPGFETPSEFQDAADATDESAQRSRTPVTPYQSASSHDFDILAVLQLAERTGRLPQQVEFWAIDGERFSLDHAISQSVQAAIPGLVHQVLHRVTRSISAA